jgi:hypothetical protein
MNIQPQLSLYELILYNYLENDCKHNDKQNIPQSEQSQDEDSLISSDSCLATARIGGNSDLFGSF